MSLREGYGAGIPGMTVADDTFEKLVFIRLGFIHETEKLTLLVTIHCYHNVKCLPRF